MQIFLKGMYVYTNVPWIKGGLVSGFFYLRVIRKRS